MAGRLLSRALDLDLNGNPGRVGFSTYEDLEAWIAEEQQIWSKVPLSKRGQNIFRALQTQNTTIEQMARLIRSTTMDPNQYVDQVEQQFSNYKSWHIIHSRTRCGQAAIKLAQSSPDDGAVLLWGSRQWNRQRLSQSTEQWQNDNNTMALMTAAVAQAADIGGLWKIDDTGALNATVAAIEKDLTDRQAKWVLATDAVERERIDLKNRSLAQTKSQNEDFAGHLEAHATALKSHLDAVQKRVAELEEVFGKKIQLEAPVEYWRKKAKEHSDALPWWGAAVTLLLAAPFVLGLVALLGDRHFVGILLKDLASASASGLALLLFFVVLYLAAARLVVKQFSNHLNLNNDAAERVVMAQTFLALTRENKLGDAERALVLAPLFRPAGTATDSDVAAGLADAIAKAVAKA